MRVILIGMDMEYEWRFVPGAGDYMVSERGDVWQISKSRLLLGHKGNSLGYRRVCLKRDLGGYANRYVHRLVLEAFVGPCPPGMQCRHLNGVATDNRLENLAWGTASEDNFDRIRHGTHQHAKKQTCKYGHPLDRIKYRPDGSVYQRVCRTCTREWNRASKRKVRKTG